MKRVSDFLSRFGATLKGCAKIALMSRPTVKPAPAPVKRIIILANGPSLRTTLAEHAAELSATPTMAVNFFANAPEFDSVKPSYYVLADPHFFTARDQENVDSLWRNIARAGWPMTLSVPVERLAEARRRLCSTKVRLASFNFVGVEGFAAFERFAYARGLAMPRPRNVLIPAIMVALQAGFTEIYLTGADHSWLETIRVNDSNEVVSVQPHFYADSKAEQQRSISEYRGYRLHDILLSFYTAFSSYHRLQRYAEKRGIAIFNATPGSFIDAFPRRSL